MTETVVKVAGTVPVRRKVRRPVLLLEATGGRWVRRERVRASRSGSYLLKVRAGKAERIRTFRVRATRWRGLRASTSRSFEVLVAAPIPPTVGETDGSYDAPEPPVPGTPELGLPTDWSWLQAPSTGRWNPCRVITWQYNPDREAYAGALADLKRAFAQVAGRTGLRFRHEGNTTFRPQVDGGFPPVDVAVGWDSPDAIPAFDRGAVGIGGNWMQPVPGKDVGYEVFKGFVAFNSAATLPGGHTLSGPVTWGQAMVHEVLHVVGLGHATYGTQIMSPTITRSNHLFGAGDVAGAVRVGALNGCL